MRQLPFETIRRPKGDSIRHDNDMTGKDRRDSTSGAGRLAVAGPHDPSSGDELLGLGLCAVVASDARQKQSASSGEGLLQNPVVKEPPLHWIVIPGVKRGGRDIRGETPRACDLAGGSHKREMGPPIMRCMHKRR